MSATFAYILVAVVGLLHIGFFYLEWFRWDMFARRLFPEADATFVEKSYVLAQNQAIYNLALALLILGGLTIGDPEIKSRVALATMAAVILVGVVGWKTASRRILFAQVIPATIAGLLVLVAT